MKPVDMKTYSFLVTTSCVNNVSMYDALFWLTLTYDAMAFGRGAQAPCLMVHHLYSQDLRGMAGCRYSGQSTEGKL
jgi:hypothetical protein